MAIDQLRRALGNGVQFRYVTFDEEYGQVPQFWFELDALGQRAIGEVPRSFSCWAMRPHYRSLQAAHAPKRADGVCQHSPLFTRQPWHRMTIKATTRGPMVWEVKAARIHLTVTSQVPSLPTDRAYWLIVARSTATGEVKYFVSNAPASADLKEMLTAAFARWHVEKWFERAKQETGFGDFEVRTYTSLIRHWLCSRMAMYFLAEQTQRLRGEKSANHAGAGGPGDKPADHDDRTAHGESESALALVG
jgi:SRSO17 transposase